MTSKEYSKREFCIPCAAKGKIWRAYDRRKNPYRRGKTKEEKAPRRIVHLKTEHNMPNATWEDVQRLFSREPLTKAEAQSVLHEVSDK
jgi:hypothetical protein